MLPFPWGVSGIGIMMLKLLSVALIINNHSLTFIVHLEIRSLHQLYTHSSTELQPLLGWVEVAVFGFIAYSMTVGQREFLAKDNRTRPVSSTEHQTLTDDLDVAGVELQFRNTWFMYNQQLEPHRR